MAKDDAKSGKEKAGQTGGAKSGDKESGGWSTDAIPDALRDAGKRAADLAQNPYARSLLAAGLVAAAAALASNKNVRDVTRRNLKAATEAVEVGAENAGKIGIAIVNAATEAVQRMLNLGAEVGDAATGGAQGRTASSSGRKAAAPKRSASAAKPKAAPRAKPGGSTKAASTTKPAAAKPAPAQRKSSSSSASKASARKAGTAAGTPKRAPTKSG